jgi:hypothetical protein
MLGMFAPTKCFLFNHAVVVYTIAGKNVQKCEIRLTIYGDMKKKMKK